MIVSMRFGCADWRQEQGAMEKRGVMLIKDDSVILEDLVLRKGLLDLPEECFWMRSWSAS